MVSSVRCPKRRCAAFSTSTCPASKRSPRTRTSSTLDRLRDALALAPDNDGARYEYLHALLGAGRLEQAREAFDPVAAKVIHDQRLAACEQWLGACEQAQSGRTIEQLETALSIDKRDLQARFELAQRHFAAQRFTSAMDDLLEILMRDKGWRDGLARKTYVAVLTVMSRPKQHTPQAPAQTSALELSGKPAAVGSTPVVDAYRRKLSMAVF
jgi:putative thioredoxin